MPIISNFQTSEKAALAAKQDRLTGTNGQVVGFDSNGNAVAQDAPDTGVTSFNGRKGDVTISYSDVDAAPADAGIKPGGTAGQIPVKKTEADYDIEWQDPPPATSNGRCSRANPVQSLV